MLTGETGPGAQLATAFDVFGTIATSREIRGKCIILQDADGNSTTLFCIRHAARPSVRPRVVATVKNNFE